MRRLALPAALILTASGLVAQAPPSALIGTFIDDYGSAHTVTPGEWIHHPAMRYRVVSWDTAGRTIVARVYRAGNDSLGAWVRIDWTRLEGMPPWSLGFCLATWEAPTRAAALAVPASDRANPRTGCNGYPFTRLAPWTDSQTAPPRGRPSYQQGSQQGEVSLHPDRAEPPH